MIVYIFLVCLHFYLNPLLLNEVGLLPDVHKEQSDTKGWLGPNSPLQHKKEFKVKVIKEASFIYMQNKNMYSRRGMGILKIKLHSKRFVAIPLYELWA